MDNLTVANTILQQLGGRRFIVMTGAKNLLGEEKGLQFNIGRNGSKANKVIIRLNGRDLYDVEFWSIRGTSFKKLEEKNDVYADMLQDIFTDYTGLYTSLGTCGAR